MNDYIINSFIIKNINNFNNIFNYIITHSKKSTDISINNIKKSLSYLIKTNIIIKDTSGFKLSEKGYYILETNIIYYKRIILRFFYKLRMKNIKKQFAVKEQRPEQKSLRDNLIKNKEHKCILCDKHFPIFLLEAAHLKPRCNLNNKELYDDNIAELMCLFCHKLYDEGILGVKNSILHVSSKLISDFDLSYLFNKVINTYNSKNAQFFDYHFKYIFKPLY